MLRKSRLLVILGYVVIIVSTSIAKVVYVDTNGPSDPGTGTDVDPFRRIQDAIDDAGTTSGDTILIQPGVYTGIGNYNIDPKGMAVTIRSIDPNDPAVVASTVIDPNAVATLQRSGGFYLHSHEDPNTIIDGLTIKRCYEWYGGAIYCGPASPTIRNCVITENEAKYYGGGIYCSSSGDPSYPEIINCVISDNSANNGAGLRNCKGQIRNCLISGNSANSTGGGLSNCTGTIRNCTVINNSAGISGGGAQNCDAEITNCIFVNNSAHAIYESSAPTYLSVVNCLFYNNPDGDWYDFDSSSTLTGAVAINAQTEANSNSGEDPLLEADGFHLQESSVCIDNGDTNALYDGGYDIDHQQRLIGSTVDIGCDEFHYETDLDYDGSVQLSDLLIFVDNWLDVSSDNEANFDGNDTVNLPDFNIFSGSWLKGVSP